MLSVSLIYCCAHSAPETICEIHERCESTLRFIASRPEKKIAIVRGKPEEEFKRLNVNCRSAMPLS